MRSTKTTTPTHEIRPILYRPLSSVFNMAARQQARRLTTPELEPFIVATVRPTGRKLGAGAYGSVVEVEIPGASVAAKKLHDSLVQFGSEQQVRMAIEV